MRNRNQIKTNRNIKTSVVLLFFAKNPEFGQDIKARGGKAVVVLP